MEDFKQVLKYIGQTYELSNMLPGKGASRDVRKEKMEAYRKRARDNNQINNIDLLYNILSVVYCI